VTKGDSGSDSGASVSTPHTQEKLCNKQYDTQEAPFGSTTRREHFLDRRNKHRIASHRRFDRRRKHQFGTAPTDAGPVPKRSRGVPVRYEYEYPETCKVRDNKDAGCLQNRRWFANPLEQVADVPCSTKHGRVNTPKEPPKGIPTNGTTERGTGRNSKRRERKPRGHTKREHQKGAPNETPNGTPNGTPKGTLLAERLLQRLPCRAVPYRTRRLQRYQWKHRRTQTRTEPNSGQRTPSIIGPTIAVLVTQRFAQQQQKLQHYWRQQQWGSGDKDNGAG